MSGIAQLFKITLQGAERYQTGADGGGSLQEARRRLVEVNFTVSGSITSLRW